MSKGISLRGIERHVSVSQGDDGGLYQMIGWRHSSGELRVERGLEKSGVELQDHERLLYVHKYGTYEHYVLYGDGELRVRGDGGEELLKAEMEEECDVTSIGHILVVMRRDVMSYYLYNGSVYVPIGRGEMPYIDIKWIADVAEDGESVLIESERIDIVPDVSLGSYDAFIGESYPHHVKHKMMVRQLTEQYQGLLSSYRVKAATENVLVDSYLVRYGYRMYDGKYLWVSDPILLRGDAYRMKVSSAKWDVNEGWSILQGASVEGSGYKLRLGLQQVDDELNEIVNNVVVAIDVFLSAPIPTYDAERKIDAVNSAKLIGGNANETAYYELTFGSLQAARKEDIEKYFNYYRVATITMDELRGMSSADKIIEPDLRDKIENIVQEPLLEYDSSVHSYVANTSYMYNGRLHLGGVTEELYKGDSLHYHSYNGIDKEDAEIEGDSSYELDSYVIYTYIRNDTEDYVVRSDASHDIGKLSSYISYPDSRAYKMLIISLENGRAYKKELLLKPHPYANASYYYAGWDEEIDIKSEEITIAEYEELMLQPTRSKVVRSNIMKVSALNNPLLWPNDKTYAVGSGRIVSMAVATKAVSEGQYGQYPLYVFTDEGVWAMSIGDGDVLYSHITPINRHVVENADTVCGIDDGVVFGTRQGLYVLQGSEAVNISVKLDDHGEVEDADNASSLAGVVKRLTGVYKESATLRSMISTGRVAYHYAAGDILLYQPNGVCYAYNIAGGVWQANSYEVQYTVDSYPKLYIIVRETSDSDGVYEIADEDSMVVSDRQLIVTQGMSLDSVPDAKRLLRLHVLSHIGGDKERTEMKIGIAVSNDGKAWALSWYRELLVGSLHNVTLPHVASGYRYYSLIIETKHIDRGSYLRGLIVESEVLRSER